MFMKKTQKEKKKTQKTPVLYFKSRKKFEGRRAREG